MAGNIMDSPSAARRFLNTSRSLFNVNEDTVLGNFTVSRGVKKEARILIPLATATGAQLACLALSGGNAGPSQEQVQATVNSAILTATGATPTPGDALTQPNLLNEAGKQVASGLTGGEPITVLVDSVTGTPINTPTLETPTVDPAAATTEIVINGATLEKGFVLPENYLTTPEQAAAEFGGKPEFWRMDTYTFINGQRYNVVDEIPYDNTGKAYAGSDAFTVMWGGAWVAEARPLRTDGIRNPDGTLYDYTKTPEYFQLSLGQFDQSGTASATWWNGKTNTYGSGSHSLDQGDLVEQAVIWAVPKSEVCETDAQQKMLASKHAMETLFKFLSTDANAAKTNVMTWDPVKGEYTSYKPGELPTGIEFDMENLPYEGHPLNTKDVSTNGGKPEQWAMDLYKDPISGNVKWGFTWNFEGRNLKTPFRINGAYFNPLTGEVMSMDQVFDLNGPVSKAVIRTPNGSIRLTYWDGQENTYGAGGADEGTQTPYAVEQAVLKTALPHNGCYDVNMHNPNLQKDGVGADIRQFIATDPNIAKIKAAVWDPIQKMWQMFAPGAIVNNIPAWLK